MLYYFNATDKQIQKLESGKDLRMNGKPLEMDRSLHKARRRDGGNVVAVSSYEMRGRVEEKKAGLVLAERIPRKAVLNVEPFQRLRQVIAGGGIITKRTRKGNLKVLLIYRRGVWDLPKGKRDRGESIEECALREVSEELGIQKVKIVQPVGQTLHGFSQNRYYRVKTTHWFEMRTKEKSFIPQASEGIKDVKWFKWKDAKKALGYKTLRLFLDDIEPGIRA